MKKTQAEARAVPEAAARRDAAPVLPAVLGLALTFAGTALAAQTPIPWTGGENVLPASADADTTPAAIEVAPLPPPAPQPVTVPVYVHDGTGLRPRPRPRIAPAPAGATDGDSAVAAIVVQSILRREARLTQPAADSLPPLATTPPVFRSPRPRQRPERAGLAAVMPRNFAAATARPPVQPPRLAPSQPTAIGPLGPVCGDPRIRGERLAPVQGRLPGCRIDRPVRIDSIAGVGFSQHPVLDCTTARTLADWITGSLQPAMRSRGRVARLTVASHYACRTRNSQPGAKLSEHAKGRAIDISGFTFADGRSLSVRDAWSRRRGRRLIERLHAAACGPFGTVLGPAANRFHRDHLHFDTARYRGGPYCR